MLEPRLAVVLAPLVGKVAAAAGGGVFWLALMTCTKIVEAEVAGLPCETLDLAWNASSFSSLLVSISPSSILVDSSAKL